MKCSSKPSSLRRICRYKEEQQDNLYSFISTKVETLSEMLIKAQIQEFPNHLNRPFKLLYLQKAAYPSNAYKKKFL